MAIDQNSIPSDLRPLNLARTVAEEPRIPTAAAVAGLAGFSPNSMVRSDVGSPYSGPMYYPVTVLDSGGNPTVAWYPYHQIPLSSGGISETPRGNVGDQGVDEGVEDSSVKKVKLMCSFGGKILPRPNDGLLRYVGGQTRIISVRRDVSFQQLQHKMIDIYGQPVVIKYQLSNEDLDALVSVSCPEDLENMMEEYGKLVENGYGKLRVFLFSASELDSSGLVQFGDVLDSGQRYIDAINGIHDGVGGIARKESIASATSTQNSDGQMSWGEAVESSAPSQGDVSGIPSPCMTSPRVAVTAAHDAPTSMLYAAPNPVMYAEPPPVPMGHPLTVALQTVSSSRPDPRLERPMPAIVPQQQPLGYNLQRPSVVDFQPPAGYVEAYVDPHQQVSSQIGYSNPQLLGVAGSMYRHPDPQQQLQANVVNLPPQQFIPAVHMTMAPTALHAGLSTNGLQHFMQPSQSRDYYPGEQFPVEQGITTYQPQTTVPLQTTGYGWNQIPPVQHVVVSDGWVSHPQQVLSEKLPKLEDCHMCQRGLPHAHSDTLTQEHVNNTKSNVSDANPVFHSSPVDGNLGTRLPNNIVVSEALGEKMTGRYEAATDQRAGGHMVNDVTATQLGVHGFAHGAELLHGKERLLHKPNNLDHTQMLFSQGMMGNPGDVKSDRSVLLGSNPQPHHEDNLQQPSAPLQYLLKQEVLASQPGCANGPPVRFIPQQTSESMVYDSTREYLGKLPFDGRVKIHTNPSDISLSNEQSRSSMNKLNKEDILVTRTQITGQDMLPSTECTRPGIVPDGNQNKLFDALPASSPEVGYFHNVKQLLEPNQVSQVEIFSTSGPYPHLNMGMQHLPADEVWYHKPTFSGDDSAHDTDSTLQTGVWKDEDPQFQSSIAPSGVSLSPSDRIIQDNWDAAPSNSLFSNHDPWTLRHDGHIPFPNTNQMPSSKEILNMRDAGVFQKPEGHLNKDFNLEHVRSDKEEHIKQELKAVAEGVAALVLQSPISAYASVHDVNELPPKVDGNRSRDDNAEAKTKTKVEDGFDIQDVGTKLSEKANSGLPISEGVGRLQIIKNSDLEELRELGSGTFGTVYHGKWRGSDVAIKRINDRCFDGKRSEEERMREDFWNEAIKLADLHHPNVVAFYGVVLDGPGGSVATVTEFMVNGSLRQALQRNDRALDKRKRLLIAMDVAFGMEYLHGKNIVHFDLKSDNLLVNLRDPHRPICKVGDLGLSKVKCHTLISGGVRGTLPWMAPELLNGSSSLVSEKVDVFSFGIVMWELLTGEEPYTDLHYGAIIGGIVSNTLRPAVPEYCDPEWRCLMERCWSAEPSERPSFTEVAKQLRLVTSSLPSKGQVQQQPQVQK